MSANPANSVHTQVQQHLRRFATRPTVKRVSQPREAQPKPTRIKKQEEREALSRRQNVIEHQIDVRVSAIDPNPV